MFYIIIGNKRKRVYKDKHGKFFIYTTLKTKTDVEPLNVHEDTTVTKRRNIRLELDKLKKEHDKIQANVKKAESALSKKSKECKTEIQNLITKSKENAYRFKIESDELTQIISDLQEQLDLLLKYPDECDSIINNIAGENDRLRRHVTTMHNSDQEQIDRLTQLIKEMDQKIQDFSQSNPTSNPASNKHGSESDGNASDVDLGNFDSDGGMSDLDLGDAYDNDFGGEIERTPVRQQSQNDEQLKLISELQNKLDELVVERKKLTDSNEQTLEYVTRMSNNLRECQEKSSNLIRENDTLSDRIRVLEDNLEKSQAESISVRKFAELEQICMERDNINKRLKDELEKQKTIIEKFVSEEKRLIENHRLDSEYVEGMARNLKGCQENSESLLSDHRKLKAENEERANANKQLQKELEKQKILVENLAQEEKRLIENHRKDSDYAGKMSRALKDENTVLAKKLKTESEEKNSIIRRLAELTEQFNILNTAKAIEKRAQILSGNLIKDTMEEAPNGTNIADVEKTVKQLREQMEAECMVKMEKIQQDCDTRMKDVSDQLKDLTHDYGVKDREISDKDREIRDLKLEVKRLRDAIIENHQKIDELSQRRESEKYDVMCHNDLKHCRDETQDCKIDRDTIDSSYAKITEENFRLKKQIEELEFQLGIDINTDKVYE